MGEPADAIGFETGSITFDGGTATAGSGTVAASTTYAKNGTYSCRVNKTSGTSSTHVRLGSGSTGNASVWIYFAALPSAEIPICGINLAVSPANGAYLTLDNSGVLRIEDSQPTSTTVATGITTGTWYQLKVAWDGNSTTYKFKVSLDNGTAQEIQRTGQSADISTTGILLGYLSSWGSGNTATFDMYVDDFISWGTSYALETTPYGYVKTLRPDADVSGSYTITGGGATRAASIDDVFQTTPTTYIGSATNAAVQVVDLSTYTLGTDETFGQLLKTIGGPCGGNGTTARDFTVRYQNASGTDHSTTATWNCNVNGWQTAINTYSTTTAVGGGTIDQTAVDGLRFKFTKSANTRLCNVGDVLVYTAIKYSPPSTQYKTLTGTLSFTSAQLRKIKRPGTSATLSFTSAQTRLTKRLKTHTGGLSFTSAQTKKVAKARTGTLSFTSAQTKKANASKSGALSFTSAQTKKAKASKSGTLSFTGAVSTRTAFRKALTATLAFTSAQTKKVSRLSTATLSFTSAQTRKAMKYLTASWSGSGALTRRTAYRQSLTGALSFTSSQSKKAKVTLNAATLSFTGAITRRVRVAYAAAGSFSGELLKKVRKTLTATLSFSGSNSQTPVGGPPPATVDSGLGWFIRWKRRRHED